jgi:hypothetical protein
MAWMSLVGKITRVALVNRGCVSYFFQLSSFVCKVENVTTSGFAGLLSLTRGDEQVGEEYFPEVLV